MRDLGGRGSGRKRELTRAKMGVAQGIPRKGGGGG